jgi:hypothetical protein
MGIMAQEHQPLASTNIEAASLLCFRSPQPAGAQPSREEAINNPVADPRAIVIQGNARFTVLTPELIRMEWAADGKFEDHASFVFINRRMPVPKYSHEFADGKLIIKTDAITLTYAPKAKGRFSSDNLTLELTVDGKPVRLAAGNN